MVNVDGQDKVMDVGKVLTEHAGGAKEICRRAFTQNKCPEPHARNQGNEQHTGTDTQNADVFDLGAGIHRQRNESFKKSALC